MKKQRKMKDFQKSIPKATKRQRWLKEAECFKIIEHSAFSGAAMAGQGAQEVPRGGQDRRKPLKKLRKNEKSHFCKKTTSEKSKKTEGKTPNNKRHPCGANHFMV